MKKTRLLSLLLVLALLASCASAPTGGEGEPQAAGRYVESDITPDAAGRFSSFLSDDGRILCYSEGLKTRYESADLGETWQQSPGPGDRNDDYIDVQSGTILQDGSLLVYLRDKGLMRITSDGTAAAFPLEPLDDALAAGELAVVSLVQALPQNRVIVSLSSGNMSISTGIAGEGRESITSGEKSEPGDGTTSAPPSEERSSTSQFGGAMTSKTLLLDAQTGEIIAEIPVQNAQAAASDGESLYIMGYDGAAQVFSLSSGQSMNKSINFGSGTHTGGLSVIVTGTFGGTLALDEGGALYTAQNGSLVRAGADIPSETVLEGTAYSIGTPRSSVNSIHVPGGAIIVNMLTGSENRLYKYVWDENAVIDPSKTINIWSLEDNSVVRAAIAEMRKAHPDALVNFEIALSASAVSVSDAIKALNTRLLGGSGPDILILDGAPAQSYAAKGMLLDLSAFAEDFDVYGTLATPYDGKTYFIPAQFSLPVLIGGESSLANAKTLDGLVGMILSGNGPVTMSAEPGSMLASVPENERPELYFENLSELCELLWQSCESEIIRENTLDTAALRRYLEAAKAISEKYSLAETAQNGPILSASFFDGGTATVVPSSLIRYTSQMTRMGAFSLTSLPLLQFTTANQDALLAPFPGLSSGAWQPLTLAAISADSAVQGTALEFLSIMLSPNIQSLNYGVGLPVTKSGMAAQIAAIDEQLRENERGGFNFDIDSLIARLGPPAFSDKTLSEMTWSAVEKCCKNEISVDEAVSEIERNIKNYLAERA